MRRAATGLALVFCLTLAWAQSVIHFKTPRAAGEHFLRAAVEGRWDDATQVLDVTALPSTNKPSQTRKAAEDLAYLLNAIRLDPTSLSEEEYEQPIVLNRISDPTGTVIGEIVLARVNKGWVFSRETVSKASLMAQTMRAAEQSAVSTDEDETGAPEGLRSPRATLSTFMSAMDSGHPGEAVITLDLSRIDQFARVDRGLQIVSRLAAILNRTQKFVISTIPDNSSGERFVLATYRANSGSLIGEIVLEKGDDKGWRFSADSIDSLDEIWKEVQVRPVIAGLRDVSLREQDPSEVLRSISPPDWLRPAFLGLAWWQICWFGIFLVIAAAFGGLARLIMAGVLRLKLKLAIDSIPDRLVRKTGFWLSLFVSALLMRRGIRALDLAGLLNTSLLIITEVVAAIGAVGILWGIWESSVIVMGRRMSGKSKRVNSLFIPVLRQFGLLIIASSVVLYTISRLGVDVTGVIAGLGIGGAILALAAKDSVENLFGSVTILFEAPFGIGDWVKVGDVEGTVEEITLRSTRIRTFADSIVVLPNRTLTTSPVENFGRRRYRRFKTTLGLSPLTPGNLVAEFSERVREHLAERADIWQEKKRVWFNDFDNVSLRILVDTYIIAPDLEHELATRDEILRFILNTADELGVNFAFPASPIGVDRTAETPKDI